MGIIQKQTIRGSIYSYLGVGIGYLNVVILMPQFYSAEEIGLTQIVLSITAIFSLVGTLGFNGVSNRLFPYFRDAAKGHNGFPFLMTLVGLLGFFIVVAAFFILKPYLINSNIEKSPLLIEYLFLLIPITFFRLVFILLDGYNKIMLDAITGTFWMDFGYKALNFIFIVLYSLHIITFQQYMFGFTLALSFPAFPVLFKLIKRGHFQIKPQLRFIDKPLFKQIITISLYNFLGASSGVIVTNIDRIMVNEYLSLSLTGIFSICALFGTIIKIPFISLNKISVSFLAEAWKKNDRKEISNIYYKSTINQMAFATLILIGIVGNLNNIFRILPEEYLAGKPVVVLYSFAYLLLTSTGAAGFILGTSDKYKIQTYFMFLTIFFTIAFNMLFIPPFGMKGAAIATVLTFLLSALFRVLFLKINMKLFPYNRKHLLILVIGAISIIPSFLLKPFNNLIVDIFIRSTIIAGLFIGFTIILNISDEINGIIKPLINRIFRVRNENK
ncbi:lipopolysaccharide biosynthesis protein [Maribellus maritimus]|uniref:lipopolysaccharide biosynthesis protein n=1 Tax=Maribellus maritimus TaxID=2870838 RepID=UPI001EECBD79|nr:lipopolysaccharide biosynthesis protein [Maribellus maritimus]MCG6188147.1 lipopolysaccharide biosynthesis protein [Maribellus maritimus]